MATVNKELIATYTVITSASSFIAQNVDNVPQEWLRSSGVPSEDLRGVAIKPGQGMNSDNSSGDLYGRFFGAGTGLVVVIT